MRFRTHRDAIAGVSAFIMAHMRRPDKPEGTPTRGKTAANRLHRVDNFLLLYDPSLLRRADGPYASAAVWTWARAGSQRAG